MLTQEVPARIKYQLGAQAVNKRVSVRHKSGKTNSPRQTSNFSFKVKHTSQQSIVISSHHSRQATENLGDQGEGIELREVVSDEEVSGDVDQGRQQ